MRREWVMVLNICCWMGVSGCGCGCWVELELREGLAGGGWGGTSCAVDSLWTSSFRTRPSLPVPVTSAILMSSSFKRPRTAGVANDECCLGMEGPLVSLSVSPTFTAFGRCCSAMVCGCCADGEGPACSAGVVVRASSSGGISL